MHSETREMNTSFNFDPFKTREKWRERIWIPILLDSQHCVFEEKKIREAYCSRKTTSMLLLQLTLELFPFWFLHMSFNLFENKISSCLFVWTQSYKGLSISFFRDILASCCVWCLVAPYTPKQASLILLPHRSCNLI